MASNIRKSLFERLKEGLEEGIAHPRNQKPLKTLEIPEEPPEVDAETLLALREESHMSQSVFAKLLNASSNL